MAPIAFPLITATCISWPPMYFSKIKFTYFLFNELADLINVLKLLQIFTPILDPSSEGLTTIG